MKFPTLSVVFTVNDRKPEVLRRVFDSIPDGIADQVVIVLDRPTPEVAAYVENAFWNRLDWPKTKIVRIEGEPGWLCPANAWNAGFAEVTSELTLTFSSDVVWHTDAITQARQMLSGVPAVLFAKCRDSGEFGGVTSYEADPLCLCSSEVTRPLGFLMAMPTWALRASGGFDPEFMKGYWYDDDDFTARLFGLGLPFIFDDSVHCTHLAHERATLNTDEGQRKVQINHDYMVKKWGNLKPWAQHPKQAATRPGRTVIVPDTCPELWKQWEKLA